MSDISKLIEAMRLSQEGGATRAAANPILPLDQPVVFDTEKNEYVRAPDVPKVVSGEPKPADAPKPAEGGNPATRPHEPAAKPAEQPKPAERK